MLSTFGNAEQLVDNQRNLSIGSAAGERRRVERQAAPNNSFPLGLNVRFSR